MEPNESLAVLFGEVVRNIDTLEKAIAEVGQVKVGLKTTASDLKSQIQDSVSRHLEALRNRETWLLGQVEIIQRIKDEVLQQQCAELNKALGRLQSTCVLLEQSGNVFDAENLECHVRDILKDVGVLNLCPEKTNAINFVAQNFELQDVILKFGTVASDDPVVDKPIASSFEMHGLGEKNTFFIPSGPCEEWLMKRNVKITSQDIQRIPSLELRIQDWLQQRAVPVANTPESSVALPQYPTEHWLTKTKPQRCPAEEGNSMQVADSDDEAVVKIEATEMHGWLVDSSKTSTFPEMPSVYFKTVRMSESSQWLKKSETTEELSTHLIGETFQKIATLDPEKWLKKAPTTESCPERPCGLTSDDNSCVMSDWVATRKGDSGCNQWSLQQSHESNAVTTIFTGIENYIQDLAAQANQQWLLSRSEKVSDKREAEELTRSGMKSYIDSLPVDYNFWLLNLPTNKDTCKWLARSSSEQCMNCPAMCSKGVFKVFDEIASSKDGWLMSQELF